MTTESILELGVLAVALSSIWIAFVLCIRIAVARWLGARWAYYLWLVPLLGLLAMGIPNQPVQRVLDIPGIKVPVVNSAIKTATGMLGFADKQVVAKLPRVSDSQGPSVPELLLITWVLGALFFLLYFSARSIQYSVKMKRSSRPLSDQQESHVRSRCVDLANMSPARFRILSTDRGPAVAGLLQPVLYLPIDFFERFTIQQQALILEHEYQHLRSHDLVYLLVARIYRSIFWFNPLVYIAERYLQLDQELSCDEKVLATKNSITRRIYGETLLLSAHTRFPSAQVGYSPSFGQIKQRTSLLRHYKQHFLASFFGGLLLMVTTSASITYGVLGTLHSEPDLAIRDALRVPMEEALTELEAGALDMKELSVLLSRLGQLEAAFPQRPLSDNELAQLNDLLALVYCRMGDYSRSLKMYKKVVQLTENVPEHQSRALNTIGEIQFMLGNYVETIKSLEQSKSISQVPPSAEYQALRSRAFVRLQHWDQGLRYIKLAIEQTEADGDIPPENWLLSQTALQWKVGDLTGAARSLEKSIEYFPEATYGHTLVVFNDLVQEVWEPVLTEKTLAQF